jgi:predicted MFS family arabinose efflux permease
MLCAAYLTIHDLSVAIYVLRALHGVVEAIIFWILFTYAAEIVPASRRTEGIAWFAVSAQIPIALGALAGDAILARASYHTLFGVTVVCAALGFLASLPLANPDHAPLSVPSRGLVACAAQRDLVPLWFVGVVFATAICPAFVFLKTYVMVRHVGSVGLFLAAYSLTAATFRVVFGWLPDRVGPKRALGPAMFAVAGGLLLVALASRSIEIGVAGVLAGAGHGLVFPILVGLVVERARPAERAVAMSLVTSVFDVGQLIGGPLFGSIIDRFGYSASYGAASALAAIGFVAFLVWDRVALAEVGRGPV